jgi:small conductance mechanosensitive channel
MNEHLQGLNQIQATMIDIGLKFGPKLLVAVGIIAAGVFASRWVARAVERLLQPFDLEVSIQQLLVRLIRVLIVGIFAMMALQNVGVELVPLLAGLGIASAGIALAMQGVLANIVAGLLIIFTRPFCLGEYLAVAGEEGRVDNINLFNTVLGHLDRSRVVIPNRKIVGEILHNYGEIRQLDIAVGIAYDSDVNQAIAMVREILDGNARVLKDPKALVKVAKLGDSCIDLAVRPWVKVPDYGAANGEINKAILEVFRARNIVIPFPQREVRILEKAA